MPAEEFLEAADAYLRRQRWEDGFATAVHLALDLDTGSYVLGSAGHPPAAHYLAGLRAVDAHLGPRAGARRGP